MGANELWIHTKTGGRLKDSDRIHISDSSLIPYCGVNNHNFELQNTINRFDSKEVVINTVSGTSVYQCKSTQGIPNEYFCKRCLNKFQKLQIE